VSAADGGFKLTASGDGQFTVIAEKSGVRSAATPLTVPARTGAVNLVIDSQAANAAIEFSDQPNFVVAGVTDFTAVGGHGADTVLRTSEDLTRATYNLNGADPKSTTAADVDAERERVKQLLTQGESAELHRRLGELDEKAGDPLTAVNEFARAAKLDASEQSYFEWGSELLLHRAIWQARDVFQAGAKAFPTSERMLTGLGSALFAGALYNDAANAFCRAADLNPGEGEIYRMLGKIQIAAPEPLDCADAKLAGFLGAHADNSLANYFYAMAILKRQQTTPDAHAVDSARGYFEKAVALDGKCADAYVQLGNLAAAASDAANAIGFYKKAIEADPQLADAHYRLGIAYDRLGDSAQAKREFELHEQIEKQQAAIVEQQRKEIKQFVVAPGDGSSAPKN
jgi:tetratricopeptide (TPR) repeat protein